MTTVAFHTDVTDKVRYTYRLARKAVRRGLRVCIAGQEGDLDLLDQALWTIEAHDFLPHGRMKSTVAPAAALKRAPIWLTDAPQAWPAEWPQAQVLIQVDPDMDIDPAPFERAFVLLGPDAQEKAAGRKRWRTLQGLGYAVQHLSTTPS